MKIKGLAIENIKDKDGKIIGFTFVRTGFIFDGMCEGCNKVIKVKEVQFLEHLGFFANCPKCRAKVKLEQREEEKTI